MSWIKTALESREIRLVIQQHRVEFKATNLNLAVQIPLHHVDNKQLSDSHTHVYFNKYVTYCDAVILLKSKFGEVINESMSITKVLPHNNFVTISRRLH